MRLASSLAVGDTVGPRDAVVVAIEPLFADTLRLSMFVDGGVVQQDAHISDGFDNAKSPPALLEALQALSDQYEQLVDVRRDAGRLWMATPAERRTIDILADARRAGIMVRFGGVYSVRK